MNFKNGWFDYIGAAAGITATFIGTVVGAGFASGQEILQFFSRYGMNGGLGVVLAVMFMFFFTTRIFQIGSRLQTESYRDFLAELIPAKGVVIADFFLFIFFLLLIGVMFAGCGAIFIELNLGYWWGITISALILIAVLYFDLSGLVGINLIIIPLMFLASVGISLFAIKTPSSLMPLWQPNGRWILASIQFSAYNLILALPVLLSLACRYSNRKALRWGGWMGCLTLGLMTGFIHWSILSHFNHLHLNPLPMLGLAKNISQWVYWGYAFILWGEMLTTLLANTYGLAKRLAASTGISFFAGIILLTITGILVAKFGFVNLIARIYPIYGYLSIILLILIFFKPATTMNP